MYYNKKAGIFDWIFGILTILLSAVIAALLFAKGVVDGVVGIFSQASDSGSGSSTLIFYGIVFGVIWGYVGLRAIFRAERSKKYANIFGVYQRIKVSEVIKVMNRPLKAVSVDFFELKKRGYFNSIDFDLENKEVVFSFNAEPLPQVGDEAEWIYKKRRGFPILALIATVTTFICFSDFIPLAIMSGVGAFLLVLRFFPVPYYFVETKKKTRKWKITKKPSNTGNEMLDDMLKSIFENKKELIRLSKAIESTVIRKPLLEILRVLELIAGFISAYPDKVRKLRQFANYYLPTTVSFMQTYEELEKKADKGENITRTLVKIEEVTESMSVVFKQEYDDLYGDKAMDISAEVEVMQAIIKENENIM
ncbi:MAG: 5-bromo-4-chloroindolyl phosphate hydrolysis family protein [Oscillospiraceae bacterium]|nr:5-bromo-4-chloroindolyl phosphate hydrolysis family protein [Oscillospiraceae bacterium]